MKKINVGERLKEKFEKRGEAGKLFLKYFERKEEIDLLCSRASPAKKYTIVVKVEDEDQLFLSLLNELEKLWKKEKDYLLEEAKKLEVREDLLKVVAFAILCKAAEITLHHRNEEIYAQPKGPIIYEGRFDGSWENSIDVIEDGTEM